MHHLENEWVSLFEMKKLGLCAYAHRWEMTGKDVKSSDRNIGVVFVCVRCILDKEEVFTKWRDLVSKVIDVVVTVRELSPYASWILGASS